MPYIPLPKYSTNKLLSLVLSIMIYFSLNIFASSISFTFILELIIISSTIIIELDLIYVIIETYQLMIEPTLVIILAFNLA